MAEYIDRESFREFIDTVYPFTKYGQKVPAYDFAKTEFLIALSKFPSADVKPVWISVKDKLPDKLEPVNIVWVNHNPESYYEHIKDKPFTATAYYYGGKWWWYSTVCEDYLMEYGKCECDEMDKDIEVTHWMPLPTPPKEEANV